MNSFFLGEDLPQGHAAHPREGVPPLGRATVIEWMIHSLPDNELAHKVMVVIKDFSDGLFPEDAQLHPFLTWASKAFNPMHVCFCSI